MKRILGLMWCFLTVSCFVSGAQSFKSVVDFDTVYVGDSISLAYIFEGETDSILPPASIITSHLKIVSGPVEHRSMSKSRNIDSTFSVFKSITLRYVILANDIGIISIPSASIKMKNGKQYTTDTLVISVLTGSGKKRPTSAAAYFKKQDLASDSLRHRFRNAPAVGEMKKSNKKWALITGFTYWPKTLSSSDVERTFQNIKQYVKSRPDAQYLGSLDGIAPRLYFVCDDTTTLRENIQLIYNNLGVNTMHPIIFAETQKWNFNKELQEFDNEHNFWENLYSIINLQKEKSAHHLWNIKLRFFCDDVNKMRDFARLAEGNGFVVGEMKDKRVDTPDKYFIDFSTDVPANEEIAIDKIQSLRMIGKTSKYEALLGFINFN